jgi:solute:Na+ symporter, SSS family
MYGLSTPDIIILSIFFLVLVVIGFWAMFRVKDQEDFFMGGRRFGKVVQLFAAFGQATSSDTGPSVATTTASNGAAGVWASLMMLFATPSYWLTGVWYRRLRVITMGDYFTERYSSKWLGGVYSVMASISMMLLVTVGFIVLTKTVLVMTPKTLPEVPVELIYKATDADIQRMSDNSQLSYDEMSEYIMFLKLDRYRARTITSLTPAEQEEFDHLHAFNPQSNFSHIPKNWLIWITVIFICLYSVAGGLEAAFISDVFQGVFIIILSVILLPFAFIEINNVFGSSGFMGAFRSLHEQLPESYFEIFGSPNSIDFTWYYILALGVMATINVAAGANQLVAAGAAKDESSARFGLTYGTFLKRVTTVFWGITALAIVLLYSDSVSDPDHLWGYASRALLGPLNMGLIGLMIAALMAALLSTADMMMLATAGLITRNLYQPFAPGKSEKHYLLVGRIFGASIIVIAAVIVMGADSLFDQLKIFWEWGVVFSAGFWMGIMWRRTNRLAVWFSIGLTLFFFFLLPVMVPTVIPGVRTNPYLLKQTQSQIIERQYSATPMDVEARDHEIALWQAMEPSQQSFVELPEVLLVGESFTKSFNIGNKRIFWTHGIGINQRTGQAEGRGLLSLELVLLDLMGWDLSQNKYSVNETIRLLIRTFFPFLIILIFSYLFKHKPEEAASLDRFYAKMKTKVQVNREDDKREMELSMQNPHRFDHRKMFPNTQWEVLKWNREDRNGFWIAMAMVFAIIGLLYFLVNLGGSILGS